MHHYLITNPSSLITQIGDNYATVVTRVTGMAIIFLIFLMGIVLIKYFLQSLSN
jgi:hypothetical protein